MSLIVYLSNDNVLQAYIKDTLSNVVDLSSAIVGYDLRKVTTSETVSSGGMVFNSQNANGYDIFQAVIAKTVAIDKDIDYEVEIDVNAGSNLNGKWVVPVDAQVRVK